jgi:hypothetical protein
MLGKETLDELFTAERWNKWNGENS